MPPRSIAGINLLSAERRQEIYTRFIPEILLQKYGIPRTMQDTQGRSLLRLQCDPGTTDVIIELRHAFGAPDPLLYAHLTDTMNGQVHVLLYVINDPESERFDVDRLEDGTPTQFGMSERNLAAEEAAMKAGLAPGQIRSGLRILKHSIREFETFISSIGHDLYFVEPLYYHNAVIFERYGFAYQQGRRLMESIHEGFQPGGPHQEKLNGSTPFRQPEFAQSIRGRSWAIHDQILGSPFTNVTMYKIVRSDAGVNTFPEGVW